VKFGISTAHLKSDDWEDAFAQAQGMGFDFIEFFTTTMTNEEAAAIAALAEKIGLGVAYHAPYTGRWDLGAADPRFGALLLRSAVEQARMMQAPYLIVHAGSHDEAGPDARREALDRVAAILETCAPALEARGITLCVEDNAPVHGRGELGDRPADFAHLFAGLPECIAMNVDFGHAHLSGHTDAYFEQFAARIRYAHLDDNHGERDEHLAPGLGSIDWDHIARVCREAGFGGPFCAEFAAGDLEQARPHLRGLLGDGSA